MGRGEEFLTDTEFNTNQLILKIKNSSENLNDEEKKILEKIISDFENNDFSLLTPQEINWMKKNESILWSEYLIYRYNFKNLPKKNEVADVPLHLLIEPVSACNLRCIMCFQIDETFSGNSDFMGMMKLDLFKKIIDDALQITFSLIFPQPLTELLPIARKNKIGIIVNRPLAEGLLTNNFLRKNFKNNDVRKTYSKNYFKQIFKQIKKFKTLKKSLSLNQLALGYILSRKEVTACIPGVKNITQLISNVNASQIQLNKVELKEIQNVQKQFRRNS